MSTIRARELRKILTEAERGLWKHLRYQQLNGSKFRRQAPIGPYIVDFVCFEQSLVIEIDGGQHSEQDAYDSERSSWLEAEGFQVLRFWNNQVLEEVEAVKEAILEALGDTAETPHPDLPPQGGKEQDCGLSRQVGKEMGRELSRLGGKENDGGPSLRRGKEWKHR